MNSESPGTFSTVEDISLNFFPIDEYNSRDEFRFSVPEGAKVEVRIDSASPNEVLRVSVSSGFSFDDPYGIVGMTKQGYAGPDLDITLQDTTRALNDYTAVVTAPGDNLFRQGKVSYSITISVTGTGSNPEPESVDIEVESAVFRNGNVNFVYKTVNDPGDYSIGLYRSSDTMLDEADILLDTQMITPATNSSGTGAFNSVAPPSIAFPYLLVVADPPDFSSGQTIQGEIAETDETNNSAIAWLLTLDELRAIMPRLPEADAARYITPLNEAMVEFQINTSKRIAAFLSQLGHESEELRRWRERFTTSANFQLPGVNRPPYTATSESDYFNYWYGNRSDLGNTMPGDGFRYRGRGPIQLTGRSNYDRAGRAIGVDLINNPSMLEDKVNYPDVGLRAAGWFWQDKGLNGIADAVNPNNTASIMMVNRRITLLVNGGTNGLVARLQLFQRALRIL